MDMEKLLVRLNPIIDRNLIKINEPMSKHTTFRVGGNASMLICPSSINEMISLIKLFNECKVRYLIVGNGSNLIVSDKGYDGVIIKTTNLKAITVNNNSIEANCGALLSSISKQALENRLSGMEYISGIPGTIGGAVAMNAGAYNVEIKDILDYAIVLNENGEIVKIDKENLKFSYRSSVIKDSNNIVLSAVLSLENGSYEVIKAKMVETRLKRCTSQPLNYPNAGSIFKRTNGQPVGVIIEKLGLKNTTIGGAKVSEKHANFIINTGNATAADIINLIELVKGTVKVKMNIDLETEVKIIT